MKYVAMVLGALCVVSVWAEEVEWKDITPQADLAGWAANSGDWKVQDGVLTGTATAGAPAVFMSSLITADFELELEFKAAAPTAGGVVFRGHELPKLPIAEGADPQKAARTLYGYRARIDTNAPAHCGGLDDPSGHINAVMPRGAAGESVKSGDWNTLRVSAMNNDLRIDINGVQAVTGATTTYSTGCFALMVDAGDASAIQFRAIRIKDHGRAGTWRALFNGQNIDDWIVWGEEEWSVEDGTIVGRSGPKKSEGYLATPDTWKDFHVRGSFKMLGEGNFGLFYHSTIAYDDKQYPVISGLQGEVAPGYPSPSGWVYESYKRGWLVEPDMKQLGAYALKPGDWNEIEIKSVGNRIITWINGVNVLDLTDTAPNLVEGAFALQLHTGGVDGIMWKDLFVAE